MGSCTVWCTAADTVPRRSSDFRRRPILRFSTGGAKRACSSVRANRRRTRLGSFSSGWRSSSGRKPAARASRNRGIGWRGIGCGILPLSAVLIAMAYEKVAHDQETEWDFAEDCLVTQGPPGVLTIATGVAGLAAMLWLYGIAWHQPMADSFGWLRASAA